MKRIAFNGSLLALLGSGIALSAAPASAQSTLYTLLGSGASDRLGASVGGAGDYDDDGQPDLIAGAPEDFNIFDPSPGYARVFSGANGSPIQTILGTEDWSAFGAAVDGAGDVNNDGWDDVVVGAPSGGNSQRGRATVHSGATGLVLLTFNGTEDLDFLARSVSRAGDVNNDGFDDVLIGVPGHNDVLEDEGRATVYSGQNGSVIWNFLGDDAGDELGISVSELGDTNSDGRADVLVGSLGFGVHVYSGINGTSLINVPGPNNTTFGKTVSSIPDVTGDGKPDFLIGATQENVLTPGPGFVQCRNGVSGALVWTATGLNDGDRFGNALAGSADLNGDGTPDAIVGTDPTSGAVQNYVRVLSGVNGSLIFAFLGDAPQDDFGRSVAGLGNLNGNGNNEFAVGASTASPGNQTARGYVRVYSGLATGCGGVVTYCTSAPNSAGNGADIFIGGSTSIAANNLVLLATGCPPNQPGIFYFGATQANQPFGNGFRCIANPIFRLLPPTPATPGGLASYAVDYGDAPATMLIANSTWNFQFWYRDPSGGGGLFNLSDAIQITFCP